MKKLLLLSSLLLVSTSLLFAQSDAVSVAGKSKFVTPVQLWSYDGANWTQSSLTISGSGLTIGNITLSGSAEIVTPRTLTTGTIALSASTTRFEFLVTPDFVCSYVTATGTTTVTGTGTIQYGVFGNRASPGRTLGATTLIITSGSGSRYDAR